ncbi:MAG: hypothetical protein JWN74_3633 [Acidobacteriaceae bacterium]|nr:hypothetical protein [Acidobacteriaceae bacterium]
MQRSRYTKNALRTATVVVALLAGIAVLFILEQRRTQGEVGVVLSAYLSDEVLNNAHDWGAGRGIQIILQREAQQPGTWRWRWSLLFDRRLRFPQASFVTRTSFVVSNAFISDIRAELHLPRGVDSVVVSRSELKQSQSSDFQRRFPNNLGYIAVSQPGFDFSKTEAILYIDHFCGLCGGGGYILMRKGNGVWHVVDQHSTWVS